MLLSEVQAALESLHPTHAAWQLELGEAENYPHWQVFLELGRGVRFSTVRARLAPGHVEPCRDPDKSRSYCIKEETRIDGPWYIGEHHPRRPGKRSDLTLLHERVLEEATLPDLWLDIDTGPSMLRYWRSVNEMRQVLGLEEQRSQRPTVYVLWGPPDTGKSARVRQLCNNDLYSVPSPNTSSQPCWWDGYRGQSNVLLEEFYGWIRFSRMLTLLDIYDVRVDYRGGSTPLLATRIFITCNKRPEDWYKNLDEDKLNALLRRLTYVEYVDSIDAILPPPFDFKLNFLP